jgi:leader peptidase (prepilin peptidase) / N-methyltransferase
VILALVPHSMPEDVALAPFRLTAFASAALFGTITGLLATVLTRRGLAVCDEKDRHWSWIGGLAAALLGAGFTWAYLRWQCQETPMVRPSAVWWYWRIGFHLVLMALLIAATATDLRAYLIPDVLTLPWVLLAIVLMTVAGDLQVQHLWIDWNQEIEQLKEPFVPDWIKLHAHLHGLSVSLVGGLVGAGAIWIVRAVSGVALRQEAMGLGDVTLMALIGSFLGWQPVVFVLLLAPLLAIIGAVATSLLSGKTYIPFGPYLSLAAVIVMFNWRRIWMFQVSLGVGSRAGNRITTFAVRRLFGDWQSLLIMAASIFVGLLVLLLLRRVYKAIPVTRRKVDTEGS